MTLRSCVSLIGAGTQGRRLAYMWSSRGKDVHLIDSQASQLEASLEAIKKLREDYTPNGRQGRVITHKPETLRDALKDSWLAVECVPERISLKKEIIAKLDVEAPEDAIIASNSSSYSCCELIEGLDLKDKTRVLSAHTYWPPETSVIEIMGHRDTNSSCIDIMMEQSSAHGFSPFHVRSPSMGYIYNRIWAAIKREALLAASEGAGTPAEIDAVFRDVLKTSKGPFELMDLVGLDVVLDIERHYAIARRNIPVEPQDYLNQFLRNGYLGVKSGRGFYDYSSQPNL